MLNSAHAGELVGRLMVCATPQANHCKVNMAPTSLFIALLAAVSYAVAAKWKGEVKQVNGTTYQCKCYSDNSCWPTHADWNALNNTVGGALQVAIPPGAPCHKKFENSTISVYSEAACAEVQSNWGNEQWLSVSNFSQRD